MVFASLRVVRGLKSHSQKRMRGVLKAQVQIPLFELGQRLKTLLRLTEQSNIRLTNKLGLTIKLIDF